MLWTYWDVARTMFLHSLALPLHPPTFYYAALAFGVGAPWMLFASALGGASLASVLHVALGAGLMRINQVREQTKFLRFQRQMTLWGVFVLLLPGLRFQGMLVILFALIGVPPRRVLLCAVIGQAIGFLLTGFVSHDDRMLIYFITPH